MRRANTYRKAAVHTSPVNNMAPSKESSFFSAPVHTGGEPMDHATRSFMENRFQHDFSNVRIHKDEAAHRSAQDINALAYTKNNNIVFRGGQYRPNTTQGKKLLAHELTHVIQQQQSGSNMIQRQLSYTAPTPEEKDPVPIVYAQEKGGQTRDKTSLGLTTPTFDGKKMSEISEHDLSALFVMNAPGQMNGGKAECKVDASGVNATVSAEELIIAHAGKNNEWKGNFADHKNKACAKKTNIPVTLTDTTSNKNLYDIILKNEGQHVTDLKKLVDDSNKFLTSIHNVSVTGKDQAECTGKLIAAIGKTANPALGLAREFAGKWKIAVAAWDQTGKHTIKKDPANVAKDCSSMQFNLHQ